MPDSTISQLLDSILKSVYGKDVRSAIYNSILQCYDDVNNPTLNLNALKEIIQEKINDGTIAALTTPLAKSNLIGGCYAEPKTSDDVLAVRIGEDGKLYAESPTPMIRFKNLTKDWGYFPNTKMVRGVDYSLTGDKANDTGVGFDDTGLHLAQGVTFQTLNKESDLNLILGHKYWMVVKAVNNTYGRTEMSLRNVKNVSYDYYDQVVSVSVMYSTNEELPIYSNVAEYSVEAKPNVENTFYLYSRSDYGYYQKTIRYVMLYDLTDSFGAGNEPTSTEMQTLFNKIYGTDTWEYNSGTITFELGGDGSKTISNIIIPNDAGSGGETGSGDSYLKGKTLYVIGDSLTAYSDWGKALCAAEGMTWCNWGFAGTTMSAPETPNYESGHTGVERVRQLPHDDDYVMENMIILIWLGINDTNLGSDADETDIHTLYGGLNDVLSYLTTTFPKTPFGIMGLHRNSNKTVTTTNEIMKQICAKYSVPFFDTESEGRIIPAYLSDGLHLGANATANIRRRIRQWIKTL